MGKTGRRHWPSVLWSTSTAGVIVLLIAGVFAALYQLHTYNVQRRTMAQEQANILAASVPAALATTSTIT